MLDFISFNKFSNHSEGFCKLYDLRDVKKFRCSFPSETKSPTTSSSLALEQILFKLIVKRIKNLIEYKYHVCQNLAASCF